MGADLPDVLEGLTGKGHQVLFNTDIDFSLYLHVLVAEEFEVVEETAGDGVLDGHDGGIGPALLQGLVQPFKGVALYNGHAVMPGFTGPLSIKKTGCLFMKAAHITLNSYLPH